MLNDQVGNGMTKIGVVFFGAAVVVLAFTIATSAAADRSSVQRTESLQRQAVELAQLCIHRLVEKSDQLAETERSLQSCEASNRFLRYTCK